MTKRKTLKETKAEYRSIGFEEAAEMLREYMRNRFWEAYCKGLPDPNEQSLWDLADAMETRGSELSREYKTIAWPRVYGEEF